MMSPGKGVNGKLDAVLLIVRQKGIFFKCNNLWNYFQCTVITAWVPGITPFKMLLYGGDVYSITPKNKTGKQSSNNNNKIIETCKLSVVSFFFIKNSCRNVPK